MVRPVSGYFADSLPQHSRELGRIAFLHLDSDWYESTRTVLHHLYDQISPWGCLQIDDYGCWEGCRRALHEFERDHGLALELQVIDAQGVWLRKEGRD